MYQNYNPDQENEDRKLEAVKRLDFYLDNTETYIIDFLQDAFPEHSAEMQPAFVNVVKKIINLRSTCYVEPAARTLKDATPEDVKNFETIERTMNLDAKFGIINTYTNLLKTVLIKPTWRNGSLALDIFTPDILDVQTGIAYDDIQKVTVTHYSDSGDDRDTTYSEWTAGSFKILDHKHNVKSWEANPFDVLPFITIYDKLPTYGFWGIGGHDLINCQTSIYKILTDLVFTCKYQSYGINVFKNIQADNHHLKGFGTSEMDISPNSVITLTNKDSDFKVVSPKAPIKDIISMIEFLYQTAFLMNGLSAGHASMKQNRQSGSSRQVEAEELREIRRSQIPTYKRAEQELFLLSKIVWDHNNPENKFSNDCKLEINYPEIKQRNQITPEMMAVAWEKEISMGVSSPVQVIMEKDPDLSRDQAIEKVELLKLEREKYTEGDTVNG